MTERKDLPVYMRLKIKFAIRKIKMPYFIRKKCYVKWRRRRDGN
jgi:hypothetical protein